jgi:hypothetical protein
LSALLGLLIGLAAAAAADGAAPLAGPAVQADREVLEQVLAKSEVERVPVPPEASYLRDVGAAILAALIGLVARGADQLRLPRWALIGIVVALALAALALVLRVLLAWLRERRRRAKEAGTVAVSPEQAPAADPGWDAAAWRAELDRCLAEGRLADGLRAAWWWLARAVAGDRVEPDWTGRDLVARSRREDLRDLVRRLDALTYGPARPTLEDLRLLTGRLEAALAGRVEMALR